MDDSLVKSRFLSQKREIVYFYQLKCFANISFGSNEIPGVLQRTGWPIKPSGIFWPNAALADGCQAWD
jgi:hypothetical protein